VPPIPRDFLDWHQNEPPLVKSRVRQYERRRVHPLTLIVENIEIEDAWRVWLSTGASKSPLHCLQRPEQLLRPELR